MTQEPESHSTANGKAERLTCAVIIATAYREETLERCIKLINQQERVPNRLIVADGAPAPGIEGVISRLSKGLKFPIIYHRCQRQGAAAQRNEAAQMVFEDVILFMDDDVYVEPGCLRTMMKVLEEDTIHEIGGVGVILTNQHSPKPSKWFKRWLDFMAGERALSYAGRVIGPAINILPTPETDGQVVSVEWLNTGCTAYRAEAFKSEWFSPDFDRYSVLEDVHLSLRVGRRWRLVIASAARAFHDSQPSRFKRPFEVARMQVRNRHLVMTEVLNRRDLTHHIKFVLAVMFGVLCRFREIRSVPDLHSFVWALMGYTSGLLGVYGGHCDLFLGLDKREGPTQGA